MLGREDWKKPGWGVALLIGFAQAFANQIGLFQELSDDQRVFLLLDLLGGKVRVRVPAERVSREA